MAPGSLEAIASDYVPGDGAVEIERLVTGLVNDTCRVVREGRAYVLRKTQQSAPSWGLDREWECRVLMQASKAGVAPLIYRCNPAAGILVTGWVEGRPWTDAEVREPATIAAMAGLLRRVHAMPIPRGARRMSPRDWAAHYRAAHGAGARPRRALALQSAADARLASIAAGPKPTPVLCHSDLHRLNVIVGQSPLLLDWEYAHVSNPYWDVAGWIANNDASHTFSRAFLESYLQRAASSEELGLLEQHLWIYDYVCLLWSELHLIERPGEISAAVYARRDLLAERLHDSW